MGYNADRFGELMARFNTELRRRFNAGEIHKEPAIKALHTRIEGLNTPRLLQTSIGESRFVVMDTETTGFEAYAGDDIVSIALLELRGLQPTGRKFDSLVNPGRKIPPSSTAIHGIHDAQVQDAPSIESVLFEVLEFIDEAILVGHHINFDIRFLNKTLQKRLLCRMQHPWLDTMLLSLAASGKVGHYTLEEVARFADVELSERHTAHGDALTTANVFVKLVSMLARQEEPTGALIKRQFSLGHF